MSLWQATANALIERLNANGVKLMMSRARTILVSLIPALVLLASVDCLSGLLSSSSCHELRCLLPEDGHRNHSQGSADNAIESAVQRWSRRLNAQPGSDGFSSPVILALTQSVLTAPPVHQIEPPPADLGLAQGWQFRWRTASAPRAPSLVS